MDDVLHLELTALAALALCYHSLGGYMARVFTSERDLRVERVVRPRPPRISEEGRRYDAR